MSELAATDVPLSAGVYALYRGGSRMYVGKAGCLRDRVWGNHLGPGRSVRSSAMRRNVAEHLGFATAAELKRGDVLLTSTQLDVVLAWLRESEVAWIETTDEPSASALEKALKIEFKPPLTKQ